MAYAWPLQIIEETLPALQELKKEGLVRNIGFSGLPLAIYPAILDRQESHLFLTIPSSGYDQNVYERQKDAHTIESVHELGLNQRRRVPFNRLAVIVQPIARNTVR